LHETRTYEVVQTELVHVKLSTWQFELPTLGNICTGKGGR